MSKSISVLALSVALGAAFGAGVASAETFQAQNVSVTHAAAVVHVIPEARSDISVETRAGRNLPAPSVRLQGGRVVIDGNLGMRLRGCGSWLGGEGASLWGVGNVRTTDLPVVTIRTPMNVALQSDGAVYLDIGASSAAALELQGCGRASVAQISGPLALEAQGSGDVRVAGAARVAATLNGSGDVDIGPSQEAAFTLNGSGDFTAGPVAGATSALLNGSGTIDIDSVAGGGAALTLNGSGDLRVGSVTGDLSARLHNSGNISIDSVNGGDARLEVDGSGDLRVAHGTVATLSAQLDGSGSLIFGGHAERTSAVLHGSGDVRVADAGHVDHMDSSGSGDISFGHGR